MVLVSYGRGLGVRRTLLMGGGPVAFAAAAIRRPARASETPALLNFFCPRARDHRERDPGDLTLVELEYDAVVISGVLELLIGHLVLEPFDVSRGREMKLS